MRYRRPAEWEPHTATWLSWPHNARDWPGKFAPVRWVFAEMIRYISRGERVRLLVRDAAQAKHAATCLQKVGTDLSQIDFIEVPTNRGWTRDLGPLFVKNEQGNTLIARYHFNAWANYPDFQLDNAVPDVVAARFGFSLVHPRYHGKPVILEGGAIDVNGHGTLLTTEECLVHPDIQVRNPGMTKADYESSFRETFGVTQTIWLGEGIMGDDTHGHVDDLCRFVNPSTVVLIQEDDVYDDNYARLQENRERLEGLRLANGESLAVVPLPMPRPLFFNGIRVPASYANFYIGNTVVLVPTFNDPNDRIALGILEELFPDRDVVGIYCGDLIWGFGAIHCLTQEEPVSC